MIEDKAFFKISYGLYLLTARDTNGRDNGSINNTVVMLTDQPKRITVNVSRDTYTNEIIKRTGLFNVSVLTESVPFELFKRFGYQSGRTVDKFEGFTTPTERAENGILYLKDYSNALISAKVSDAHDYGTHTLFVAEVTEAKVLNDQPSVTYCYYSSNIKPKANTAGKKGYVCTVCGYIYEGEPLPEDFICPICKHPASAFVKLQ
ncbi:MAG TPA: flavin reductase [Clostridia bacterium]|jgi:flavin reductase (DIM6/NTAB) family NADH-FMN oxidoreductase RutF|nr:flavin reductase [Clostridia bacterium]HOK82136.1 flavin reductase [Clostridia bacterium]HOL61076.1 flavin reductase [Clostridia bacterium]HPO53988.1 flavin reductase [Clostridia bacterium]